MKNSTLLTTLALLTALALLVFNETRVNQKIAAALRERLAPPPSANAAPTARTPLPEASDLRAATMDLQRARQALAAAEQQLTNVTSQVRALEQQLAAVAQAVTALSQSRRQPIPGDGAQRRPWGPEQATGPADTLTAGDLPTAWAPRQPDGGEEWLRLEYETPVLLAEVHVYESYNPGAISKLTTFLADGREVTIWEGTESEAAAPVARIFAVPFAAQSGVVKIYLDTRRVAGWNEIDAVELVGRDGSRQWAKQATASSTYAEQSR